ncbi:MAG TPA: hypothetical protein VF252_02630 [Gemmatimonadales bacterium]
MKPAMPYRVLALSLLALLLAIRPGAAQGRLALGVAAGPSPYDLAGTGTGTSGAALLAWRPVRGLVVEPGVTVFSYVSQFGTRTSLLFPELSVQGELVRGSFRPFIGGGAGSSFGLQGEGEIALTLHAVGGARVDLSDAWSLLGEMRIRAVRPWTGNTVDFLFGVSRRLQQFVGRPAGPTYLPAVPVDRSPVDPGRFELAGHLGVHVDRPAEADRVVTDRGAAMYATAGEASAFSARLGYWLRPALGLQFGVSHSSNAAWEGSTPIPPPGFANRTTYLSARGVVRTSPVRPLHLFAAAGPALMLYGGTGENLRTRDADLGGVLDVGARLRMTPWLGVELALSNYFYGSQYRDEGSVFRHDLLILPGLVFSWN